MEGISAKIRRLKVVCFIGFDSDSIVSGFEDCCNADHMQECSSAVSYIPGRAEVMWHSSIEVELSPFSGRGILLVPTLNV